MENSKNTPKNQIGLYEHYSSERLAGISTQINTIQDLVQFDRNLLRYFSRVMQELYIKFPEAFISDNSLNTSLKRSLNLQFELGRFWFVIASNGIKFMQISISKHVELSLNENITMHDNTFLAFNKFRTYYILLSQKVGEQSG